MRERAGDSRCGMNLWVSVGLRVIEEVEAAVEATWSAHAESDDLWVQLRQIVKNGSVPLCSAWTPS
jgi:hypothetical protein